MNAQVKFWIAITIGVLEAIGAAILRMDPVSLGLTQIQANWIGILMAGLGVIAVALPALPQGPSAAAQEPHSFAVEPGVILASQNKGRIAMIVIVGLFITALLVAPLIGGALTR